MIASLSIAVLTTAVICPMLVLSARILAVALLFGMSAVNGASVMPGEQDIQALEKRIATASELSDSARDALSVELTRSRQQLRSWQTKALELEAAQDETVAFEAKVQGLQNQIRSLIETVATEPPPLSDEQALSATTEQLEHAVWQLRRNLSDVREREAWLSLRADEISTEMAALAEHFDRSGQHLNATGSSWKEAELLESGASMAARVKVLVERIDTGIYRETVKLLQLEIATLAPRQMLAALQGRQLQLRLQKQMQLLDQHWITLYQSRSDAVQNRIDRLALVQDKPGSVGAVGSRAVDERVSWAQAELSLLEQELEVVRRSAQVSDEVMEIHQIRQLLGQINATGELNDSLTRMIQALRQQLPDASALSAEWQELQLRQKSLQVDRILWESALRGNQVGMLPVTGKRGVSTGGTDGSLEALVALLSVANRVSDKMVSLETTLFEAQTRADEVASTLEGSVLWLRSNESAQLSWITNGYGGLLWIINPDNWKGVGRAMLDSARTAPLPLLVLALCVLLTISIRPRLAGVLTQSATAVGNVGEDHYWHTPAAIGASLLWTLPAPLVLMVFYWAVKEGFSVPGSLVPALSGALLATAIVLCVLLFFKTLCRSDGVFRRHFEWDERSVDRLYQHLRWFIWVSALCTTVFTLSILSGRSDLRYGVALMMFIILSIAMSALLYVCLRPGRGVAFQLTHATTQSPITRMSIWAVIAIPAIVGLLPLAGYFDIAVEIQNRAFASGIYLMITALLVGLALREFTVAHRRMSLRKLRARRAAREAERSAQLNAPVSGDATPDLSIAYDDDHRRIALQAQQLLKIAGAILFVISTWLVWEPLFPVLDVFNEIILWRADGSQAGPLGDQAITLGKLLFATGVIVLGMVGSRNLRGLLEILVYERLNIDAGARYAITAIASYTLVGTTLLIGIAQLGVDWSRLQWIVAALGVGLGFGLQEIVANFISGLIILFERPVRVGDTVTIGGLSGTVSNIQIRATTLTDFDNREVLLPNKSIITENVTNWTLHDAVTRILLSIDVAYGSDIEQVRTLLMGCLDSIDDVLDSPEPTVFFVNHGSSSLEFEVRAFVATPAHRLPVTHALNSAINASLSRQGIEIPFPQSVVQLRPPG